ncbi:uncharacterized protein LOC132309079 [Cornus florida]|uniref:uncharacterized protein LOC132309079 n=1 Tax=Cornus florida TaxID=4283 RepID=UPI00289CCD7A|nr:uncharacterized protein LOC132309079 [Cornus florida]
MGNEGKRPVGSIRRMKAMARVKIVARRQYERRVRQRIKEPAEPSHAQDPALEPAIAQSSSANTRLQSSAFASSSSDKAEHVLPPSPPPTMPGQIRDRPSRRYTCLQNLRPAPSNLSEQRITIDGHFIRITVESLATSSRCLHVCPPGLYYPILRWPSDADIAVALTSRYSDGETLATWTYLPDDLCQSIGPDNVMYIPIIQEGQRKKYCGSSAFQENKNDDLHPGTIRGFEFSRDDPTSPMSFSSPSTKVLARYPSVSDIGKVEFAREHFYNNHAWKVYNKMYIDGPIKSERNVTLKKLRDSPGKKLVNYIEKNNWLFFTKMEHTYSPDMEHYFYTNIRKVYDFRYFEQFEIMIPPRAHHIEIMPEMDLRAFNKPKSAKATARKNQKAMLDAIFNLKAEVRFLREQRTSSTSKDVCRQTPPEPSLNVEVEREEDETDDDVEDDEDGISSDSDGSDDEDIPTTTIPFTREVDA